MPCVRQSETRAMFAACDTAFLQIPGWLPMAAGAAMDVTDQAMKPALTAVLLFLALLLAAQAAAQNNSFDITGAVPAATLNAPDGRSRLAACQPGALCKREAAAGRQQPDGLVERKLPAERLAYVNQIALSPDGTRQCGVASVAMVLAMIGLLEPSDDTLAYQANEMWNRYPNPTFVRMVEEMLDDRGLDAEIGCMPQDMAWEKLTRQIDEGYPAIIGSARMTRSGSGHFFVVVGYREEGGRREVIAHDPYGQWLGPDAGYRINIANTASRRGEGVVYDFDAVWGYGSAQCAGGYLVTARPAANRPG